MRAALMSLLRDQAHRTPRRPVAEWGKEAPTYLEAYSLAGVLTRYFVDVAGLESDDAVLLSSPDSMGQFCALAAIQACGAKALIVPTEAPQGVLGDLLARESPRVALVADPATCACVRDALPDTLVFSMGAPEVDAPSMGYMADQAIGLVDEVYLKVEDYPFDETRDVCMAFVDFEGRCEEIRGSALAAEAEELASSRGLTDGVQVGISAPFSTHAGVVRLYAAFLVGATIVLRG